MDEETLGKIMDKSYAAARDMLMLVADELDLASETARNGQNEFAARTAHGIEDDLRKALGLIAAVTAIQQT